MNAGSATLPLNVVVAGSTSAAGRAVTEALVGIRARVAAVDLDRAGVESLAEAHEGVRPYVCNLADLSAVNDLADRIRGDLGAVDGLIHLVGGWRGGEGIPGQTDEDWNVLHTSVLTTLRNTSRTFYPDLEASPAGRMAIVSAVAAARPTASGAGYAAIKAASEAWVLAMADGFRRAQSGHKTEPKEQTSAATVFVVKALVDESMRLSAPQRTFPGYTDVKDLAGQVAALFSAPASDLNGTRQHLA
ncbi:short-chain dehydrogenase/reductase SDR [Arthrobacter crystallopoietes BAB-32]|uniref:Short-chain dehydrogenase/reductase SDR n=1 Tax=Arthrobacter crystallopoietes BAB-32 TaxID=1246476 RepID=N1UYL9_9MICC|nr:SDR family oxidoreductase [Arthrobacter crystallopoietes]EMY34155.1 short-chain dehydrogenase/reductase SDR [Arthrobacter crystallopoietes BAB-32]